MSLLHLDRVQHTTLPRSRCTRQSHPLSAGFRLAPVLTEKKARVVMGAVGLRRVKSHYKLLGEAFNLFEGTLTWLSEMLSTLGVFSLPRSHKNRNGDSPFQLKCVHRAS